MSFRFLEWLFVVLLFLASMHVVNGLTNPHIAEDDPNAVASTELHMSSIVVEGSIDAVGILLMLIRWKQVLRAARASWPLLGLSALAMLSTTWSADPGVTLRRSLLLLFSILTAIYLGERYSMDELARRLAHTFCLMMIAVIVLWVIAPFYVVDNTIHTGAWKGLSGHKNTFGGFMAIAVLLLLLVRFHRFPLLRYVFLITSFCLLVLSHSAGALSCTALIIVIMPLWRWARLSRQQRLLVSTISVLLFFAGIYLIVGHADVLLEALGRDATLTGRTYLWAAIWPAVLKHPILGYGYDTFWTGLQGEVLNTRIAVGWLAEAADNGYLDLCLGLGVIGLGAFLAVFAVAFCRAIDYVRLERGPLALWPVSFLSFILVHNIIESGALTRGALPFLLLATIFSSLSLSRKHGHANLSAERDVESRWPATNSRILAPTQNCG
jgi:exopolysaccharide production protein ExoQ